MLFILLEELFSFLRNLNFCSDVFSYLDKRLDNKAKIYFKICDFTNRDINNCNYVYCPRSYKGKTIRQ